MPYRYLLIPLLFIMIGCGVNNSKKEKSVDAEWQEAQEEIEDNITTTTPSLPSPTPTVLPTPTPTPLVVIEKNQKTVTIYVHGYKEKGYKKEQNYGQKYYDTFKTNLIKYSQLPSNLITAVDYYGDTPPYYYNAQDLEDIEAIDKKYGGGIPKYAHIVAKFAKEALRETNASQVNIVSVSMGSLVSRWLIEKDVEQLSSKNKIAKWITVEGVIRGNYALSQVKEDNFLLNLLIEKSADTKHMRYQWIEENLNPIPSQMNSPHYKNIEVAQISLTDGKDKSSLLKYLLPLYGSFIPNDGFQLYKDTYFENNISHTILHQSHVDVKNSQASFLNINNYLKSNRRIQITLLNASLTDIYEEITQDNKNAEIVFESKVFSPNSKEKWEMQTPIDERLYKSGILPIHYYKKSHTTHNLNQVLFDGFVDQDEKSLDIFLEGFEIDNSQTYNINESESSNNRDSIGLIQTTIELKNGVYEISSDDWSGYVKVEVIKP